ncbi:hypothetical protein OCU04_007458 [Sclerotinia nivalis]|uniref:Ubiquinol-cytochrome-c reductase complex assembly factor 2 n=1 Tax=Sclerotinia nivalis TaxID=352851 RepID=A0A9X0DHY7_9HELO|nr:hypothetical protein OCU04_007458 [Sclerotinia nivalis]
MSQSPAYRHYLRALSRWPKDALRPEAQFQDAIRRRIERISAAGKFDEKRELVQCNALYSLLEDRYRGKVRVFSFFFFGFGF